MSRRFREQSTADDEYRNTSSRRHFYLAASVGVLVSLGAGSTWAATDAASNTAEAANGNANPSTVGEVVVTARRRAEDIEKVPEAITAFSQQALTARSIHSGFDLAGAVPGLMVNSQNGNSALANFNIRGHGQDYQTASGSVETYFADVPLSGPFQTPQFQPQFFDVQNIQVLKGPQGTLFGRNTTGGAVVIVPQTPTDNLGGYVRLQGGDYNDFQFEGAVNLPLAGDKAILRVAGFEWQRAGYSHTLGGQTDVFGNVLPSQSYDNENETQLRATLLLRPVEGLENSTIVSFETSSNRTTEKAIYYSPSYIGFFHPGPAYAYVASLGPYVADIDTNLNKPYDHLWFVSNTTTYQIPSTELTLKNIFGLVYVSGYSNDDVDVDGTPLDFIDIPTPARPKRSLQLTDEVQIQGKNFDDRFNWVVGGLIDTTRQPGGNNINVQSNTNQFGGWNVQLAQSNYTSYSVYGSGTFKLTDQLSATAGIRNTWDDISVTSGYTGGATDIQGPFGPAFTGLTTLSKLFEGLTYNADLEYHITDRVMIYGGYRHGYKRGGFNSDGPPATAAYQPETDEDYNIGVKTRFEFAGMSGNFNVEAYTDLYRDSQTTQSAQLPAPYGIITLVSNVPKATFRGIDADLDVDVTPWLKFSGSYSYIDARYTDWPDNSVPGMGGNLAINPIPFAPKNQFSLTPRFHVELKGDEGELAFAPTFNYVSTVYTSYTGARLGNATALSVGLPPGVNWDANAHGQEFIPAYMLINLRFEWNRVMGSKVNLAANVTNLTNKAYETGDTALTRYGIDAASFGTPRMINFEVSTKF